MLARRELSEAQLRQRLLRRGHAEDEIDVAIDRLKRERALDDARVAEAIARTEASLRHRGRLRVRRQIERAGIAPDTARQTSDEVFADIDEAAQIEAALNRRLRDSRQLADDRQFRRLFRFLVSQGFEPDQVFRLLSARRRAR